MEIRDFGRKYDSASISVPYSAQERARIVYGEMDGAGKRSRLGQAVKCVMLGGNIADAVDGCDLAGFYSTDYDQACVQFHALLGYDLYD